MSFPSLVINVVASLQLPVCSSHCFEPRVQTAPGEQSLLVLHVAAHAPFSHANVKHGTGGCGEHAPLPLHACGTAVDGPEHIEPHSVATLG